MEWWLRTELCPEMNGGRKEIVLRTFSLAFSLAL